MKAVVYSSTPLKRPKDLPAYNASAFPCHEPDVELVYLNGSFPEIQAICDSSHLECKPFSQFKQQAKRTK